VGVLRYVRVPATPTQILTALLDGPTAGESSSGLQSFLTVNTPVTATVTGDIATVDFTTSPVVVVNTDQTLAIAQVVFTATQLNGVKGVVIQIDGVPTPVPGGNGVYVNGPVSRSTYSPQAPLS
jgi:spore germination protein GerM